MTHLIFKSVKHLYWIVLWWVATSLPSLILFVLLETIDFPIWIPIQLCLYPPRICLNPYLTSILIVHNSIPIVFFLPILFHMLLSIFSPILLPVLYPILYPDYLTTPYLSSNSFDLHPLIFHFHSYPVDNNNIPSSFNVTTRYYYIHTIHNITEAFDLEIIYHVLLYMTDDDEYCRRCCVTR